MQKDVASIVVQYSPPNQNRAATRYNTQWRNHTTILVIKRNEDLRNSSKERKDFTARTGPCLHTKVKAESVKFK